MIIKQKLNAIADSISPSIDSLKKHRSLSKFGEFFLRFRSEKLMRDITFQHQPVDCLLLAITHLEKDENDLAEALAWLNQVHVAYSQMQKPNYWHTLADVIRLDIMTQLNGIRLAQVWKSELDAKEQLKSNNNEKLATTHDLLLGLLGYHLGRDVEMNKETVDAYNKLLSHTKDPVLIDFINQRTDALKATSYLDPGDFGMCKEEFEIISHYKEEIQEFIDECCLNGHVPKRPEFEEKLTKTAYELAGLSVFAGPAALIAIPSVLIATPVLKLIDWSNYKKDQRENEMFYATLDDAHEWIQSNIKNRADKYCSDFKSILEEVSALQRKFSEPMLSIENNDFNRKLTITRNSALFEKYYLGDKFNSIDKSLDDIENKIKKYNECKRKIADVERLAEKFLDYLKSSDKQLRHRDGKYHPGTYDGYECTKNAGKPLSKLPEILHSYEEEFDENCEEMTILMKDITSQLNSIKADIKNTVDSKKEKARNQNAQAEQLEQNVRRTYF